MSEDRFRTTEEQYFRLRGMLETGQITREQFEHDLQGLMFQDAQGRYWMLGVDSGKWYVHDGQSWVEGQPPGLEMTAPATPRSQVPTPERGADAIPHLSPAPSSGVPMFTILTIGAIVLMLLLSVGILFFAFRQDVSGVAAAPTATRVVIAAAPTAIVPTRAVPTNTPAPTATITPRATPTHLPTVAPSGFINTVTLAQDILGPQKEPFNPTIVFQPDSTFHAVVATLNAPANTKYRASWYATDVGNAAAPNALIDSVEITTQGSHNIDFALTPKSKWPVGAYRVEIFVNGNLERITDFSVK